MLESLTGWSCSLSRMRIFLVLDFLVPRGYLSVHPRPLFCAGVLAASVCPRGKADLKSCTPPSHLRSSCMPRFLQQGYQHCITKRPPPDTMSSSPYPKQRWCHVMSCSRQQPAWASNVRTTSRYPAFHRTKRIISSRVRISLA